VIGIWYAFVLGMLHQIVAYAVVIATSDWEMAKEEAHSRQRNDYEIFNDEFERKISLAF
jgi:hypothetical protein